MTGIEHVVWVLKTDTRAKIIVSKVQKVILL